MIHLRPLQREEISQIPHIDRREVIENIYYFEDGDLVLHSEPYDMQGWPPGEAEKFTPTFFDCFDRGGWFYGAFEAEKLVAVAVLESKYIGEPRDQLQLSFLHVSRDYRDQGLGRRLFSLAAEAARLRGARRLYISATPSEHTINFYLRLGCTPVKTPDPDLYALEPEDIHLEYHI